MTPGTDESAARQKAVERGPVSLRHPEFRNLWIGTLVSTAGTQMAVVAIAWHVYVLTASPVALGLIGVFKAVPVIVLGLGGGVVADARDRRKLLIVTQTVLAVTSATLAMGLVNRENLVHEFRSRRNAGVSPA